MKTRRIIRWLAGDAGLVVVGFLLAVTILPRILDGQAAKEKVRVFLSEETDGTVTIEKIDFFWRPLPGAAYGWERSAA